MLFSRHFGNKSRRYCLIFRFGDLSSTFLLCCGINILDMLWATKSGVVLIMMFSVYLL